ncbi:TonB-dependent receptor domain-containing protein [Sphingomonas sp. Root241]|uniref:TonB-dependent receptor domain-containing protein n=1 Tax=Sphingomonas sp. Root241 TaxID=1736501 RepID=UPI0006F9D260|nr:TonB-dependent receptor [Sphingomonas sp. Root241]KRC78401.1 TonB-dependent receptor [Sphingomonas sp. Root241]
MRKHRALLVGSAVAALVAYSSSAAAQGVEEGVSPQEASPTEITVTGTRIQQPGLISTSPVTTVDSGEIRLQGATNIENVLNRLPQVTADANENVSNGSDGTARVNLRNLGSNRNLILVNGQRLLPIQATDVNFLPSFLVDRVDVVTGGASAVYGSDAISGVVNFILRKDLNGVLADVQYGFSNHHNDDQARRALISASGYQNALSSPIDGQRFDANIAVGKNFADGRGNIMAYFGYREVQPITQANRDVSACALDPTNNNTEFTCGGSSNNEFGLFQPLTGPNAGVAFNNTRDGAKTWVPYDSSFRYNYAPLNYFQRNDKRYTAGAFARFEADPAAEVYASFMFMDDRTNSQVAPSALFQGTTYTVNCNNPLISAQQGQLLCGAAYGTAATQDLFIGYRPVAAPARPRRDDLRHTDFRVSGGVRGEVAPGISYDVNGLFSRVLFNENYQNDIDPVRANRGLNVVNVNGVPTCRSVVDGSDPACVPLNAFQYAGLSAESLDYIYSPTFTRGMDKETVLSGTVTADLTSYGVQSPWADQGLGIVLGVEHRRESLVFHADALAQQKGTLEARGAFNVTEFFTEVRLPIFENRPFAEELTLTGGYRYSKYSTRDEGISTYKGEIAWAPIRDIRFRAGYNRAIRAPNISELFAAQGLGNISAQDPCSGASPSATAAQCAATGVSAAQYGHIIECPSEVCVAQGGGNPALRPEQADTYTAGVVLSPRFLKRFSLSIDYFNIKVRDYISSIPASLTISQCIATGDPFFCSLFHRDPRTGVLFGEQGYVISTTQNTGSLKTSGFDIGANYAADTGVGGFSLSFIGTWLKELRNEPLPGLGSYDCVGLFGPTCGQPSPEWRHQARLSWSDTTDIASVSLNWRYIGPTKLSNNTDDPFLTGPAYVLNASLPAYSYFDLALSAKVQKNIAFRLGVNNLLDKDPPAVAQGLLYSFGNGNTYPGVYDVAGRTFFIGLNAEF